MIYCNKMATNIVKTRLPELELSYGKTLHKKVRCDAFQILPKGKKCMLWFTYKLHENVAFLLLQTLRSAGTTPRTKGLKIQKVKFPAPKRRLQARHREQRA